jgi:hypothetical protein
MAALRYAMSHLPYDQILQISPRDRQRVAKQIDTTLRNCEAMIKGWCYSHPKGQEVMLNSSRLIIPWDLPGPVVLDATAKLNPVWSLMESRALLVPSPQGARNYRNVILRVARSCGGLGKGKMLHNCNTRIPRLLDSLQEELSPDSKVLLCLHKCIKDVAMSYGPRFASFSVANWGAIDGKNDWDDHDTAVIFGMPYRDVVWPITYSSLSRGSGIIKG